MSHKKKNYNLSFTFLHISHWKKKSVCLSTQIIFITHEIQSSTLVPVDKQITIVF